MSTWKEPQVRLMILLVLSLIHPIQPFEIFRAIENKDIMFLMEVRDRAFHVRYFSLLVNKLKISAHSSLC